MAPGNEIAERIVPMLADLVRPAEFGIAYHAASSPEAYVRPDTQGRRPTLALTVGPEERATFWMEARTRVGPRDVPQLASLAKPPFLSWGGPSLLVVAAYISRATRTRLREDHVNYCDLTGNAHIVSKHPPLLIETHGADRDPAPADTPLRSLRGAAAGRVVRALLDFRPPLRITDLATRADSPAPTVYRVVRLLAEERLIDREPRGPITDVDWVALIRRWADDYSLLRTNTPRRYLEPRGLGAFIERLRDRGRGYAVTASLAAAELAPVAEPRLAVVYVAMPVPGFAAELDLREADSGANVIVAKPFDGVVFQRTWTSPSGLYCAAASQVAVDLLTSPGRGPSEGERLIDWMRENEDAWRE